MMTDTLTHDERTTLALACEKTIVKARSWDKGGVWVEQKDGGEATVTLDGRDTAGEPWEPDWDAPQCLEVWVAIADRLDVHIELSNNRLAGSGFICKMRNPLTRRVLREARGAALPSVCRIALNALSESATPTSEESDASDDHNLRRSAKS